MQKVLMCGEFMGTVGLWVMVGEGLTRLHNLWGFLQDPHSAVWGGTQSSALLSPLGRCLSLVSICTLPVD